MQKMKLRKFVAAAVIAVGIAGTAVPAVGAVAPPAETTDVDSQDGPCGARFNWKKCEILPPAAGGAATM